MHFLLFLLEKEAINSMPGTSQQMAYAVSLFADRDKIFQKWVYQLVAHV